MTATEPDHIPASRALTPRPNAALEARPLEPLLPQAARAVGAIALSFAAEYALRRIAGGAGNSLVRALASRLAGGTATPTPASVAPSRALVPAAPAVSTNVTDVTERVVGVGRVVVTEFLVIERRIRRP